MVLYGIVERINLLLIFSDLSSKIRWCETRWPIGHGNAETHENTCFRQDRQGVQPPSFKTLLQSAPCFYPLRPRHASAMLQGSDLLTSLLNLQPTRCTTESNSSQNGKNAIHHWASLCEDACAFSSGKWLWYTCASPTVICCRKHVHFAYMLHHYIVLSVT